MLHFVAPTGLELRAFVIKMFVLQFSHCVMIADIEAEVRAIQAKRQQTNEEEVTNKVSLTGGVNYDTDIYGHKEGRYEGYVTSIAANEDLEVCVYNGQFVMFH